MKKYFKEEQSKKISLQEYWFKTEKEYKEIEEKLKKYQASTYLPTEVYQLITELKSKKSALSLKHARIKHIYSSLGDVQISEDMIDTICETFNISKCRYGTICLKPDSIKAIYEISEMFPELSKESILSISKQYIKDLFDKYSLIETLAVMIRKEGTEDSTFEKFMDTILKLADKEDKKYDDVAWYIRIYCGEYTYDFVKHFEKFVKEHHISWEHFSECLPSPELMLKDQLQLKEMAIKSKDCWDTCDPITFQMLEDYLDGDKELSQYKEQPLYYISTSDKKTPTTFTKTQFIESIQEKQISIKKKRKK